jgi:heat shock protein HtpX
MSSFKVFILMMAMMALFVGVGYLVGGQNGMVMAFLLAIVMNFVSYWFSDKIVLKMYRAREISAADHPRLWRVVSRVAVKADNMPMPKVYIVPSKGPNAFATGRSMEHAAVAATEGLLEMLNEDELEGVIGHEIAHIRNKDMLIGTIAATFAGAIGILASIAKHMALADALEKLHRSPVRLNLDERPATAHMMIVNPLSGKGISSLFSTHPPVAERVKRLRESYTKSIYEGFAD